MNQTIPYKAGLRWHIWINIFDPRLTFKKDVVDQLAALPSILQLYETAISGGYAIIIHHQSSRPAELCASVEIILSETLNGTPFEIQTGA